MKNYLFICAFLLSLMVYSCTENSKTNGNNEMEQETTQRSSLYNCVQTYLGTGCVNLNLADVTVSIPGYPGCFLTIRQEGYHCPDGIVFGETRIVGLSGNCFDLMNALAPGNYNNELEWEEVYLSIKAALNKAAMDAHLATLLPALQFPSATLIEATCYKMCSFIDPITQIINYQDLYCGFGCCKKKYNVVNGQAIFISATELSPCNLSAIADCGFIGPGWKDASSCIMNCN